MHLRSHLILIVVVLPFGFQEKSGDLVGAHVILLSYNATIVCLEKYNNCFKRFEQGLVVSTRKCELAFFD